jgi:hypothetical protein
LIDNKNDNRYYLDYQLIFYFIGDNI